MKIMEGKTLQKTMSGKKVGDAFEEEKVWDWIKQLL